MFSGLCFLKRDTTPERKLESGDYGYSYVAKYAPTNRRIVIKQIYFDKMEPNRFNSMCAEYLLIMRATGRYLNPPIGFIFNNPIMVATKEVQRGNLHSIIRNGNLDPSNKTKIALGVAYGMRRLHKMKLVHGNLKSKNILIEDDMRPVISDIAYGTIAKVMRAPIQFKVSDHKWCANEVIRGEIPTEKSDVYSFGILMLELMYGAIDNISPGCIKCIESETLDPIPNNVMLSLILSCLNLNPSRRPDFRRIYRLFKNMLCYFEGTDLDFVKKEICLIKMDRHKSRSGFAPLASIEIPNREMIQKHMKDYEELQEQRRAKMVVTKSKMSLSAKDARTIPLKTNRAHKCGTPIPSHDSTICNLSDDLKQNKVIDKNVIMLNSKNHNISLNAKNQDLKINMELSQTKKEECNCEQRPKRFKSLGLRASAKGRISPADRFKTVDDVDGKNYLRLPRRLRANHPVNNRTEESREMLYKSFSSLRTTIKNAMRRLFRSQERLSPSKNKKSDSKTFIKKCHIPTNMALSKQLMPLISPLKSKSVE